MLLFFLFDIMLIPPQFSSPQGRIFQVEYAQEAVKQGSVVVGLSSKNHVVLCALKVRKEQRSQQTNDIRLWYSRGE